MKREALFHFFFLLVFGYLLYQFGVILEPFITPILSAIVLIILAYPMHSKLSARVRKRSPNFHAAISTAIVSILIIAPLFGLCYLVVKESETLVPLLQKQYGGTLSTLQSGHKILEVPWVQSLEFRLRHWFGVGPDDFEQLALQAGQELFGWVSSAGKAVAANAFVFIFQLAVLMITVFFLFRDGDQFLAMVKELIPMRIQDKERILSRLRGTVNGIIRGAILTALVQAITSAVGYLIVGVPAAITLGFLTGMASFIPFVGTALVWGPVAIAYLIQGTYWKAAFLLGWGGIVIVGFDHFLRTILIGSRVQVHFLLLFFALLGGAEVYGVRGLFLGPILVTLLPVFVDIYRGLYLRDE